MGTHFTAEEPDFTPDPDRVDALINLLKINRNLIFIADSDKKDSDDEPKAHILRIKEELKEQGIEGISVWITAGKEVENYIPIEVVPLALDDNELEGTVEERRYENNVEAIQEFPKKKSPKKVTLAHDIAKNLTKEMLENTLDLEARLEEACREIRKWNGLP